ncbi:hypothetical protein BDV23DRAFT_181078 [Aspergillus alliaceus]|uniref:Uncharacterized protein n=1 Tax=Petromyces alliaceus TaxID=209559 RepID=A0A5N7CGN5_PETAA|nr:hypothetical protein BDV23DRAFT_181078 [Aspergillus alliaceus]
MPPKHQTQTQTLNILTPNPNTSKTKPKTPDQSKDKDYEILSDSDISVLDLGPSLTTNHTTAPKTPTKPTIYYQSTEPKTRTPFVTPIPMSPPGKHGNGDRDRDIQAGGGGGDGSADTTPRKIRTGSSMFMRGALRTFPSPLLGPFRGGGDARVVRQEVTRAKTFRGGGGVSER